jgi:hypothetical protein
MYAVHLSNSAAQNFGVRVANGYAKRGMLLVSIPCSLCSCGINLENQIRETRVEFGERTVRVSS